MPGPMESTKVIVLDMDSSESPTYAEQEGSAYNSHFGCTCYHALFVFNQLGDVERCALRPGNVHSADGWRWWRIGAEYNQEKRYGRHEQKVGAHAGPSCGVCRRRARRGGPGASRD
jgi:hypothetical protein